jgi:nickel-dependent lactate racemase
MVIGVIEPHQFLGFTGGAKEAVVGCGSEDGIRHNHGLIKHRPADDGVFGKTPMRDDIDEAGRLIGIDFAVNLVLNADGQVACVLSGDAEDVLKQGMEACEAIFGVEPGKKFDMVLASCADASDDLGFYRAQKSFSLVSQVVKKGGKIILLAALNKGLGEDVHFDYVCPAADPAQIEQEFIDFWHARGAGAADLFGGMLSNRKVLDIGDIDSGILNHCHLRAADPSSIMAEWIEDFEGTPEIAVIPRAAGTYFFR